MKGIVEFSTRFCFEIVKRRLILPDKMKKYPVNCVEITLVREGKDFIEATPITIFCDKGLFYILSWFGHPHFTDFKDVIKYTEEANLNWQQLCHSDTDGNPITNWPESDITKFEDIDWGKIEKYLTNAEVSDIKDEDFNKIKDFLDEQ